MARSYTYQHNININYKETGAQNLGKNLGTINTSATKTTKTVDDMNKTLAKSTKSTNDVKKGYQGWANESNKAGVAQENFTEKVRKSEQGQSKFGESLRRNRGLLFGSTGLASSLVEAGGMYGIYTDALVRKNEAQAEVNRLEAEGLQGTKEYSDAQQELAQQTRAFIMFQRNMALSMFDTVTFVTMLASSLLPRLSKETLKSAAHVLTLGQAFKTNNALMMSPALPNFTAGLTPIAGHVNKTTGALTRMRGVLATMGLTNPFFIAITAIGAVLAAVAFNVGGLRDRFNELGVSMGEALPFLKPLLDALGSFSDLLSGMAGQNNIANATDQFGNLTKEAEDFRAQVIQTDRALTTMFENLSRQEISTMFSTMRSGVEEIMKKIQFVENPVRKWVEDMIGVANPELEAGLQGMIALWDLYGDDLMGAKVTSKEGVEAKAELEKAIADMIAGGAAKIEETLPIVQEKMLKLFDIINMEKLKDSSLSPRIRLADEVLEDLDKMHTLTADGMERVREAIKVAKVKLKQEQAGGMPVNLEEIAKTIGLAEGYETEYFKWTFEKGKAVGERRTEDQKKSEEDYLKAVQDGKDKLMEFLEEDKQRELDLNKKKNDEKIAMEEEQQERLIDIAAENAKKLLEIEDDKDKKRKEFLDSWDANNIDSTIKQIKLTNQYETEVKNLTESTDVLSLSNQQLKDVSHALATKYTKLGMEGITWESVLIDITTQTGEAKDEMKSFDEALLDIVKTSEDFASTMAENIGSVVEEEILNKSGKLKNKIDFGDIAKDLDITKKAARRLTLPIVVSTVIQNESEALDSIDEFINALESKWISGRSKLKVDNILGEDFESDMDNLLDNVLDSFTGAIKKKDRTEQDEAFISFLKESMKIDWEDLSPEEAVQKLQEIKARLEKEGFSTDGEEGDKGLATDINKQLGLIATPPEVQQQVSTPVVNGFNDISEHALDMESDLAFNFEFMSGDAATAASEITTSFDTGFQSVIDKGSTMESELETNFGNIGDAASDARDEVNDLSDAIDSIPTKKTVTITVKSKFEGARVGGVINSSMFTDSAREGGVIGMQHGGIITEPMMYRGVSVGEHSKPEAVIPLSNPNNLGDKGLTLNTPINFHLTIEGNDVLRGADIWQNIQPRMGRYQSKYGGR